MLQEELKCWEGTDNLVENDEADGSNAIVYHCSEVIRLVVQPKVDHPDYKTKYDGLNHLRTRKGKLTNCFLSNNCIHSLRLSGPWHLSLHP